MEKLYIEGDRLVAFLIINKKVYASDAVHQDCLESYYADKGIESEFDYSDPARYDKVHEAEVKKTAALKDAHEVFGFDLFSTGKGCFLLAHDKLTFDSNIGWMEEYRAENKEHDIRLGYFTGTSMDVLVA